MTIAIEFHYQHSSVEPKLIADVLFHSKEVDYLRSPKRMVADVQVLLELV